MPEKILEGVVMELQEALVKRRLSFVQFLLKHQKSEREIFSLEDNDCPV